MTDQRQVALEKDKSKLAEMEEIVDVADEREDAKATALVDQDASVDKNKKDQATERAWSWVRYSKKKLIAITNVQEIRIKTNYNGYDQFS